MTKSLLPFRHDGHVTKRTFRFAELDEEGNVLEKVDAIVGSIYIKKKAFDSATPPTNITLTIEW